MVTNGNAVELVPPHPAQPGGHAATLYILYALLACCLVVQLLLKASPGLVSLLNALMPRATSARRTGTSSGTTEALVYGRPAAQRGTGTTGARSTAQCGRWHLLGITTLLALSVLPGTQAAPKCILQ